MPDLGTECPRSLRRVDLHHVEARLQLTVVFHKPVLCRADDTALLCIGDKLARLAMIRIFTQLCKNLNKLKVRKGINQLLIFKADKTL